MQSTCTGGFYKESIMNLDAQQMFDLAQGAEYFEEQNGAVFFSRFTKEEIALYRQRPDFLPRAVATAGIQMEFVTDADALLLAVTEPVGETYNSIYAYDILVNGVLIDQLTNLKSDPENGHYTEFIDPNAGYEKHFPLGKGKKQVRIVFPWSMNLGIRRFELQGANYAHPVPKQTNLLIYGDSITQGSTSLYPSQTYTTLLGTWLNAKSCNKAVGSEMYYPELAQVKLDWKPDVITVAYGINDWYYLSQQEFADRCRCFWAALCQNYPHAKKFALTPIYYLAITQCGERPFGPLEDMAKLVRQITAEFSDITVIDCMDFVSRDSADFGDLYVHPNHIGFKKFFQNLSVAMMPYLK